jgi:S1-C subfamily serine protease
MKRFIPLVLLLLASCSHTQNLINPAGQTYTCSSYGWGIIGGPMGISILNNCVEGQKQLGYVEIEKVGVPGFYLSEGDPPSILRVQPQGPAARAGMTSGDKITSVNGNSCHKMADVLVLGFGNPGQVNTYEVVRGEEKRFFSFALMPKVNKME